MRLLVLTAILAGSPATSTPAQTPGEAARQDREARFDAFFSCIARRPAAAAFALDSAYDGGFTRRNAGLGDDLQRCARAARVDLVRINPFLMRGGVARAAWMASQPAPTRYAPPAPASAAPAASDPDARLKSAAQDEALAATFAACLLAKDRPNSEAFTRAQSGSAAERAAFAPLAAHAPTCAVDAPGAPDGPMGGDRLRAALALQLWAGRPQGM